ncbi:unnamed protein product [Rotaria sp. Silwood1]|nr:unnamed protein product [Rotaria sp. Silwood1]
METHYLTEQHQRAAMEVVRQMLSQLKDKQMNIDLPQRTTSEVCNPAIVQLEELHEMLNVFVGGVETLTNDGQRLVNELLQIQTVLPTLTEDLSKVKLSIEESKAFLEGARQNQNVFYQYLLSLEEKTNDLQFVSYDGTLVWKITNFREKMNVGSVKKCKNKIYTSRTIIYSCVSFK